MAEVANAYVSLLPSTKGFGRNLDSQIGPGLDNAGKTGGKRFGGAFKSVLGPALGIISVGAVVGLLKGSIGEAREAQKVGAQTEAVIKSTGGAAKLTAKEFGDLATSISLKTGIDDEQIQAGENMLATFTNVRNAAGKNNDIFSQATKVATDLAVATGTDQVAANVLLGKALNDPAKGLGRLTKIGVTFTDQQKKQVAEMVKAGDTAGAQKIILKELGKEFGGSAEAQVTAGDKMTVAIGNLKEEIGTALLPVIDKLAKKITNDVVPAISTGIDFLKKNPGVVYGFAAAVAALGIAFIIATAPISLTALGIAALVGGLVYAYTRFETFRNIVDATFAFLKTVVATVLPYVTSIIKGGLDIIVGLVKFWKAVFTGDWQGAWDAIKQVVSGVWQVIKTYAAAGLNSVKALLSAAGPALLSLAGAAFGKLRDGAVNAVKGLLDYVGRLPGKIKSGLGSLGGLLLEAGKDLIRGLIDGIKSMAGSLVSTIKSFVIDKIPGPVKKALGIHSPSTVFHEIGVNTMLGLENGIAARGAGVQSTLAGVTDSLRSSVSLSADARLSADSMVAASQLGGPMAIDYDQLAAAMSQISFSIDRTRFASLINNAQPTVVRMR